MTRHFMEASIGAFFLVLSVTVVFGAISINDSLAKQIKQQEQVLEAAQAARDIMQEFGYLFAARTLEAQGAMSPTDADAIVSTALEEVSKHSERMAIVAKSVNDVYLKQQRSR